MVDGEVAVSQTSALSAPVTVHGIVFGPVSLLKTSKTKNGVNYRVKIRLRLQNLASLSSLVSLSLLSLSRSLRLLSLSSLASSLSTLLAISTHMTFLAIPLFCVPSVVPSVYATLVHTMELAFYRSSSVHATLVHTMGIASCRLPSILATLIRTYHGRCILLFTVRTRVTLIHTIAYCKYGARSGSPQ